MDLVCGYSSSDDDEGNNEEPVTSRPAAAIRKEEPVIMLESKKSEEQEVMKKPAIGSSATTDKNSKKKKKGVIFSALPLEIQNALTRGISGQDSDSDDDNTQSKPVQISSQTLRSSELIGLLPKPKNNNHAADQLKQKEAAEQTRATAKAAATTSAVPVQQNDDDDDDYESNIPFNAVGGDSDEENDEQQPQTETERRLLFTQSSSAAVESAYQHTSKPTGGNATEKASSVPYFQPVAQLLSINTAPSIGGVTSAPFLTLPATAPAISYSAYPGAPGYHTDTSAADYDDSSTTTGGGVSGLSSLASKRKREREIEAALLSGNLDAADAAGIVKEMRATNDWDENMYSAAQQREAEVYASFKIGSNSAMAQPSKTQSRKHQITSLAAQAAKTELAMLEAKGNRMKTKSETKGKYGW